jgi:catechol 2,3-dioxygenase-like lactoylglutathione lyase family enzyme
MIIAAHAVVFAEDAEQARAFFRDVLDLPNVDAGGGWLIFRLPPTELAVHPGEPSGSGRHSLYLVCDDIDTTIAELAAKGVTCSEVSDEGWGLLTSFPVPGAGTIGLYQARHPLAHLLPDQETRPPAWPEGPTTR